MEVDVCGMTYLVRFSRLLRYLWCWSWLDARYLGLRALQEYHLKHDALEGKVEGLLIGDYYSDCYFRSN